MSHIVFISHAKENNDIADLICKSLEKEDIKCWIASRDIEPGELYPSAIISAMKTSQMVVLILSKTSNLSRHVMRELERALNEDKPIIPFRIEDVKLSENMEYLIGPTQYLDASNPPIESHIPKLVELIKSRVTPIKAKPKVVKDNQIVLESGISDVYFCAECGAEVIGNFCETCGAPIPTAVRKKLKPDEMSLPELGISKVSPQDVIENIQKVFNVSGIRIDLEMLRDILPLDASEFNSTIFDLADRFGFKIELEILHIIEEKKEDFINALIKELSE